MTITPRYPLLFQINTRLWLRRLRGKRITLAHINDATIRGFAQRGFDWIWLLSAWQTGVAGRGVSRNNPDWRAEFNAVLPDLIEWEDQSKLPYTRRRGRASGREYAMRRAGAARLPRSRSRTMSRPDRPRRDRAIQPNQDNA
jgi:hypothetical protein